MRTRAFVLFWGCTAASVLLLGSTWDLLDRAGRSLTAPSIAALVVAALGFCGTFFVAARIAFVVGRLKAHALTEERARR